MSTPRERLILDERIPTTATIRERILNRIVDGIATIKDEQIIAADSSILKYSLLNSETQNIDKVIGTRDGYDIVLDSGTDYYLGTGINANTLIFYDSNKTVDSGTSMWVDYTYQDTVATGITKKEVGGIAWIITDAFSQVISEMYGNLAYFANQTYVNTASGTYLEMLGTLVGVNRQSASKSTGVVWVINNSDQTLTISSGASVSTFPRGNSPSVSVTFTGGHNILAGASGSYSVEAQSTGNIGIGLNMLKRIVNGFSTTSSIIIKNLEPIGGGQNEETDESLRTRIKTAFDSSGESNRATKESIRSAVLACSGVEYCQVYDAWGASVDNITDLTPPIELNGFAQCYIQLESKDTIFDTPVKVEQMTSGNATKAAIRSAIDSTRAAGCTVWLKDVQDVLIDIILTATVKSGYVAGDVQTDIETQVKAYINDQFEIGEDIYTSQITSLVYNIDGVLENSITCNMYEATPLYQVGYDFSNRMWKLDDTKKAPIYVIAYDTAAGTATSSEVSITFNYRDTNGDEQTDGAITIPNATEKWVLINPTIPLTSTNTRRIDNVIASGITDGDKFQFRSRRLDTWIRIGTAEKAWSGILNIQVS